MKNFQNTKTFYWKNFDCELCKAPFPNNVKTVDDKNIYLKVVKYDIPVVPNGQSPNYLVLESVSIQASKVIHVVDMNRTDQIKIGRGHD